MIMENEEINVIEEPIQEVKQVKEVNKEYKSKQEEPLSNVVEFAKKFTSTGSAFLLASLGVITQTFHNGFLAYELSSFENFWLRLIQSIICAFFISGALLFFTVRSSNSDDKVIKQLVIGFFIFEIFCNIYYWANKYIIIPWNSDDVNYASMIIAIPFSIMIPFTIKAYATELKFNKIKDNEFDSQLKNDIINQLKLIDNEFTNVKDDVESLRLISNEAIENSKDTIKDGDALSLKLKTRDENGEVVDKTIKATIIKN